VYAIEAARLSAPRSVSGLLGVWTSAAANDVDNDDEEEEEEDDEEEEEEATDRCTVMASRTANSCRVNASRTSPSALVRRSSCCRAACASSLCVRASSDVVMGGGGLHDNGQSPCERVTANAAENSTLNISSFHQNCVNNADT
jgi:hypothetical protein